MDSFARALIIFIVVFIVAFLIANYYLKTFAAVVLSLIIAMIVTSFFVPREVTTILNPSTSAMILGLVLLVSWILILVYLFSAIFSDVKVKNHTVVVAL